MHPKYLIKGLHVSFRYAEIARVHTRRSTDDASSTVSAKIAFIADADKSFRSHVRITYRANKEKVSSLSEGLVEGHLFLPFAVTLFTKASDSYAGI